MSLTLIEARAHGMAFALSIKAERDHTIEAKPPPEDDWEAWLHALFPRYTTQSFGQHHREFWDWVWSIRVGVRPNPFIAIWPRGGAKSTSVELALAALAARGVRRYALYVGATQEQADDHVANVATLLESEAFSEAYPTTSIRMVGKYGNSRGWRRNRLRTASGFTLDALGLDTAARGVKLEEQRPDLEVIDDIDDSEDSPGSTDKKERSLTRKLFPAGTDDVAIMGAQNLVLDDGIFARLAHGKADYLSDRYVSGPLPAIQHLDYEQFPGHTILKSGEPVWAGQDLAACQRIVDSDGITSFLIESQHETDRLEAGTYAGIEFQRCDKSEVPPLVRIVVWTDPAVTDKDSSDSHGIQVDGLAANGTIYRLYSWEQRTSPEDAIRRAVLKAIEYKAECVGIETDQGGDTWQIVYEKVWRDLVENPVVIQVTTETPRPVFREEKAGAGFGPKAHRQQQMLGDYERGVIIHVRGGTEALEKALKRFPIRKPFDVADAAFWAWCDLVKNRVPVQL